MKKPLVRNEKQSQYAVILRPYRALSTQPKSERAPKPDADHIETKVGLEVRPKGVGGEVVAGGLGRFLEPFATRLLPSWTVDGKRGWEKGTGKRKKLEMKELQ
ncbi:hypothetical protein [Sulfidibacter corallicola]|uniref:Uncharacterized protein n=1 Tax=Sulfidibacter corallicola TaxID=2818388 RepID=A0A8A4TIJ9_SULCO|nr:hypothetical protein [Sulfidibacter corallicola]QTD49014.1 hypothetical protein J3U87_25800 [Sulfidibacter corallicola]